MSAAALTAVGMAVFMIMLVAVVVAMILPVRMRMIVAVGWCSRCDIGHLSDPLD